MKVEKYVDSVEVPQGVSASYESGIFKVSGEKGEVSKKLFYPNLKVGVSSDKVVFEYANATKREKKIISTYKAHLRNLFRGVIEGHTYELKICSGHFPMNVSIKDDSFIVKNFIGEKVPRTYKIRDGVKVKIDGDKIIVEDVNKEKAGQTAADIEQLTRRTGFDRRIFQDGIYITLKDGKKL
ncbi:50S ribosomal protein L6 [Candidatus Woesearchaeota archaeon]|nr:50S ribosomal protein L6 [Candidatus Woesearchaeota archaeon]